MAVDLIEKERRMKKKQMKANIKVWRKVRQIFFTMIRTTKKREIFQSIIDFTYRTIDINYITKKIIYKDTSQGGEGYWTDMVIGYFEVNSLKDHTYESKILVVEKFVSQIIIQVLAEQCKDKNLNVNTILKRVLIGQEFSWWVKHFSKNLIKIIAKKIINYYFHALKIFEENFKYQYGKYLLIEGSDFFTNEYKRKLLKEFKISQAEKYFKATLMKSLKGEINNLIQNYKDYINNEIEKANNKFN